ncbi:hypothetical protein BH09BAC4_BH09BAC4_08810 [soil metagenome]
MNVLRKCLPVVLLVVLIGGCHTESIPPQLTGDWLWESSSGGIGGMIIKPQPSQRVILTFSGDGQFSVRQNDTLAHMGTYRVTKAQSIYSGKEELKIETKEIKTGYQLNIRPIVVTGGVVIALSANRLSIGDNIYDGFGSSFVRQ